MRFQIPQYIEIEDKIFGNFTFKQFVYLAGSGGFAYIIFKQLPIYIALILAPAVAIFGIALAFYKINNQPFLLVVRNAFAFFLAQKMYLWKKDHSIDKSKENIPKVTKKVEEEELFSHSKLHDLATKLDILDTKKENHG